MGQDWLWMRKAKISFGLSPKTYSYCAKIVIDGMSIPLIEEGSNKASSTKNNSSNSMESKPDLTLEELVNIFKKLSLRNEDNMHRKKRHEISETATSSSGSDSKSTSSDWYDLDPIKPRKNRDHSTKKKVVSPIRKHRKNKHINCVRMPE